MFKKTLFIVFCVALSNSIMTKKRMDNYYELQTSEGDVTSTNDYCAQLDRLGQCQFCYVSFLV